MTTFKLSNQIDYSKIVNELVSAVEKMSILNAKLDVDSLNKDIYLNFFNIKENVNSFKLADISITYDDVLEIGNESDEKQSTIVLDKYVSYSSIRDALTNDVLLGFNQFLIDKVHKLVIDNFGTQDLLILNDKFDEVNNLLYFMLQDNGVDILIKISIFYYQFIRMRLYKKDNELTCRSLLPIYINLMKGNEIKYFYISESLYKDKINYESKLFSNDEDINDWINYFLSIVSDQFAINIRDYKKISELIDNYKEKLAQYFKPEVSSKILKSLFMHPKITSKCLANDLDTSTAQAIRYIKTLLDKNIIKEADDKKRNKYYYFIEMINLFNKSN